MTVDVRILKIEDGVREEGSGHDFYGVYTQIVADPDTINYDTVQEDTVADSTELIAELEGRADVNYV